MDQTLTSSKYLQIISVKVVKLPTEERNHWRQQQRRRRRTRACLPSLWSVTGQVMPTSLGLKRDRTTWPSIAMNASTVSLFNVKVY